MRRPCFVRVTSDHSTHLSRKKSWCLNRDSRIAAELQHYFLEQPSSKCFIDSQGVLVRRSTVDEATQTVVPEKLRTHVLSLAHHTPIVGHLWQRHMYDKQRREYYWPHMACDVYPQFMSCTSNESQCKYKLPL